MNAPFVTSSGLTPRMIKAVEVLSASGDVTSAAAVAKVSKPTVYRWLRRSDFRSAIDAAESAALQSLASRLVSLTALALKTLEDVMSDPAAPPSAKVQASGKVLDGLLKLRELITLESRVTALEVGHENFIDAD